MLVQGGAVDRHSWVRAGTSSAAAATAACDEAVPCNQCSSVVDTPQFHATLQLLLLQSQRVLRGSGIMHKATTACVLRMTQSGFCNAAATASSAAACGEAAERLSHQLRPE